MLQVLTCTEHEQERLQWYCRTCQRLLCPLCKLRRIHHGHKVLPIAQAYQALKVILRVVVICFYCALQPWWLQHSSVSFLFGFPGQDYQGSQLHFGKPGDNTESDHSTGGCHQTHGGVLLLCFVKVAFDLCTGATVFARASNAVFWGFILHF